MIAFMTETGFAIRPTNSVKMEADFQFVASHIKPGSVVVEVGANRGDHTAAFSDIAGDTGTVWAFEASPDYTLAGFGARWGRRENVRWIQKAAASKVGLAKFHVSSGGRNGGKELSSSSSLMAATEENARRWPAMRFREIEVETTTLDLELSLLNRVAVLWLDVQGAEMEVLLGARHSLRWIDMVCAETHEGLYEGAPSLDDVGAYLKAAHGFNNVRDGGIWRAWGRD